MDTIYSMKDEVKELRQVTLLALFTFLVKKTVCSVLTVFHYACIGFCDHAYAHPLCTENHAHTCQNSLSRTINRLQVVIRKPLRLFQ